MIIDNILTSLGSGYTDVKIIFKISLNVDVEMVTCLQVTRGMATPLAPDWLLLEQDAVLSHITTGGYCAARQWARCARVTGLVLTYPLPPHPRFA